MLVSNGRGNVAYHFDSASLSLVNMVIDGGREIEE